MGFFQKMLEFLGLRKKKIQGLAGNKAKPALKPIAEKDRFSRPSAQPRIPSGAGTVVSKKKFAFKKSKISALPKRFKAKTAMHPLQFEVEQILAAALSLKKKIEARKKHAKPRKKRQKTLSKKEQRRLLIKELKETLTPLSAEDLKKMKNKVSKESQLTDVEIQRLRFNLNAGFIPKTIVESEIRTEELDRIRKTLLEKPAASITEKELRTEELEKIRKSLSESSQQRQVSALPFQPALQNLRQQFSRSQGNVVQVPEGSSVFIGKQIPSFQQPEKQKPFEEPLGVDDEISATERLLKALEQDYLKRRISEQEYRQRVLDLNQKLRELKIKKKIVDERPVEVKIPASGKSNSFEAPAVKKLSEIPQQKQQQAVTQFPAQPQPVQPSLSPGMQKFLQERVGQSNDAKLSVLESNVQKLMKKYNLSEAEAEERLSKIDRSKLMQNFDKLVDLVELEQKTQRLFQEQLQFEKERKQKLEERPEFGSGFEAGVPKKKLEEVKAIVAEVQKHRIITDFDNLLELVQRKGKVSGDDALKELKISRGKLKECISVLEQNSLLRVDFPPIGPEMLYDINYVQPAKPLRENSRK